MPKQKLQMKEIDEPFVNIALDTINKNKQALIFTATKASAESCADKIPTFVQSMEST